jgi:hypothetical protein
LALEELSVQTLEDFLPECDASVQEVFDYRRVLHKRLHKGSTGLNSIVGQISSWRRWTREHTNSSA